MSRIGKKPITIPKGVTVKVLDGAVEVQGPKGKLRRRIPAGINFELADGHLVAKRASDEPELGEVPRPGAQPGGERGRPASPTASSASSTSSASATAPSSRASR